MAPLHPSDRARERESAGAFFWRTSLWRAFTEGQCQWTAISQTPTSQTCVWPCKRVDVPCLMKEFGQGSAQRGLIAGVPITCIRPAILVRSGHMDSPSPPRWERILLLRPVVLAATGQLPPPSNVRTRCWVAEASLLSSQRLVSAGSRTLGITWWRSKCKTSTSISFFSRGASAQLVVDTIYVSFACLARLRCPRRKVATPRSWSWVRGISHECQRGGMENSGVEVWTIRRRRT